MTSKERVHASLCRKNPDRVPVWMWYHPETVQLLAKELDIPPNQVSVALEDDVRQAWVSNNHAMEGIVHQYDGESHTDQWGIRWKKVGSFNQIVHYPLKDATDEEIDRYQFPYEAIPELLQNMNPIVAQKDTYFIGCDVSPCLFELICRLRNMQCALLDFLANPGLTDRFLEKAAHFNVVLSRAAVERFALDCLWTGDDVGGQQAMMLNPAMWRERVMPFLKKILDVGKERNLWIAYHCCGVVRPIIPDLIEIGVDILNPVQANCPGMDPMELKKEFGNELSFMGGVDTQGLLPNGSASEVRNETERLIDGMMEGGGGYILAASHAIPPETPIENIYAMYEAAGITKERIKDNAATIRGHLFV